MKTISQIIETFLEENNLFYSKRIKYYNKEIGIYGDLVPYFQQVKYSVSKKDLNINSGKLNEFMKYLIEGFKIFPNEVKRGRLFKENLRFPEIKYVEKVNVEKVIFLKKETLFSFDKHEVYKTKELSRLFGISILPFDYILEILKNREEVYVPKNFKFLNNFKRE